MNKVILIGNLTKDVTINEYGENTKCSFRIAVNSAKDKTDYFDCVCWNQSAKFMQAYCVKGSKVGVEGRLAVFTKQNNEGYNTERYYVECNNVELLMKATATTNADINNAENNFNQKVSQNTNTTQKQNTYIIDDDEPF